MFTEATLRFLRDLSANNDRTWFSAEKDRFTRDVKVAATAYAVEVEEGLKALTGLAHRHKLFRIHRDLRFAKDKTPYNTHVHVSFTPVDKAGATPSWMVGLSPEYFSVGCGVFSFDRKTLENFRVRVAGDEGAEISEMLDSLVSRGARIDPPELKRVPTPYPGDHPQAVLLRRKGLAVWIDGVAPEDAVNTAGVRRTLEAAARLQPVFNLLNTV